jgi:ADP-ribosylglycohydrolase
MDQYSLSQRFQGALLGATIAQSHSMTFGRSETIDLTPCLNWLCHQGPPPNLEDDAIANAIALLPLWLYTHESWRERQNRLEQLPHWQSTTQSPLWLYGEAIAQLLRPTCNPNDLLPNLIRRWQQHAQQGAPELTQPWLDCLTQIHQWQQQRTPLHEVQTALTERLASEQAMAIALYCFVRSPDDWAIAQALLARLTDDRPISGLLGGIWGAYNGWTRFPIAALSPTTGHDASQQLLQTWSGRTATVTTTPLVIGPR